MLSKTSVMLAVLTTGSLGKHFLQQFEMYPTMN